MHSVDKVTIGTIIFINDGSKLYGILQATNAPLHYVTKSATTSVEIPVRVWYKFSPISLRNLPIAWKADEQRWIGRNVAVAIVGMMLKEKGPVMYPEVGSPFDGMG